MATGFRQFLRKRFLLLLIPLGLLDFLRLNDGMYDERRQALYHLNQMGPEAAPAVPALVRILFQNTDRYGVAAADALIQSGPAGRDTVLEAFAKGPATVRVCLI